MPAVKTRKKSSNNDDWLTALATIEERIPYDVYAALRDRTIKEIRDDATANMGYGWSGGKDAIALSIVAEAAGITQCVRADSDLEYPAFIRWADTHAPAGLTVLKTGPDLAWLADHPHMLFPRDSKTSYRWYQMVQQVGWRQFYDSRGLDAILTGHRIMDGNFISKTPGLTYQVTNGRKRWAPLARWTHDDVLACIHYEGQPIPPIYAWPRGFIVGTGPWAKRGGTRDEDHGWEEIYSIDPGIVHDASRMLPGAAAWLSRHDEPMTGSGGQ